MNMDGHSAKWNKPGTKRKPPHDCSHMELKMWLSQRLKAECWLPESGGTLEQGYKKASWIITSYYYIGARSHAVLLYSRVTVDNDNTLLFIKTLEKMV